MNEKTRTAEEIKRLIHCYFNLEQKPVFVPRQTPIPLSLPSFGWEEVSEAVESMLSTHVTMGEKVKRFEIMFADYIGVKHAIMVNSGSSANLLALSVLTNLVTQNRIQPAEEIITPAITWATTVFPIINSGAVPVLVDVDLETFNLHPDEVEKAITDKTRAIMLVHLLGNPCNMMEIVRIAKSHNLYIIEDSCEAHGAEYESQKVGSFGNMATFSFFFSHHISTIEGGMVLTNNDQYAELTRALRVFGWIRDLKSKDKIAEAYQGIDPRFLFINAGYNFRPMEIQGAFGIHQIGKLEKYIQIRQENAQYWNENLRKYSDYLLLPQKRANTRHVWFGYPVTVKPTAPFTKEELIRFLEEKKVETRPIMAGNIDEQPCMRLFHYRKTGDLPNARFIMRNSFFFGNHHGIGQQEREAIVGYIDEFMAKVVR